MKKILALPLIFLILVFPSALLSVRYSAENFATLVWISLLLVGIYLLFKKNVKTGLRNLKKAAAKLSWYVIKNKKVVRLLGIFVLLLWLLLRSLDKTYYLGGDDTRLFYLYPENYFENFASIVAPTSPSGMVGFLPPRAIYYFSGFLTLLNKVLPWANLQSFLYSLNLILGVYFFYKFSSYISTDKSKYGSWVRVIASLFYTFSIFNIYILYNSKLIAIYLVSIFPLSLYLFTKAVWEKKAYLIFILALLWSVFAVISAAIFWFAGALIVSIPIAVFLFWDHKLRFLKYTFLFLVLLTLLNIHWLIYLPYTTLFQSGSADALNSVVSSEFLESNIVGIRLTALKNTVFYPLFNLFHYQIQRDFSWPYLPLFESWYLKILPLNSVFIVTVLVGAILLKQRERKRFGAYLAAFLLGIYLFTVDLGGTRFGNWGVEVFVFLNRHIPGFVVFRNMYDKFAFSLSFSFALVFSYSLGKVIQKIKTKKYKNYLLVLMGFVVLLNAKPFVLGEFDRLPVWKTNNSYHTISDFNEDYLNLVEFVRNQDYRGRYLWVPINGGNIVVIEGADRENHFYVGVSPLLIMSGKNDYSGLLSFGPLQMEATDVFFERDFKKLAKVLQDANTKYVIVNKDVDEDILISYLYRDYFNEYQDESFYKEILGTKIASFGQKYDLYEINDVYDSETIFLTTDLRTVPDDFQGVSYKRVSPEEYEFNLENLEVGSYLVFLDPFFAGWDLYNEEGASLQLEQSRAFGYANAWRADFRISGEKITLLFTPVRYAYPTIIISATAFLLSCIYIVGQVVRRKSENES